MPELSLRQFVATHLKTTANFHDEAERLVDMIPTEDRAAYLRQSLIPIISEITGQRRRNAFDAAPTDPDGGDHRTRETRAHPEPAVGPNFARQDAHRAHWRELCDSVGIAADGGRKRVGDMTAADLTANIEYRENLARENLARARQFRALLAQLENSGAETVDGIYAEVPA